MIESRYETPHNYGDSDAYRTADAAVVFMQVNIAPYNVYKIR